MIFARLEIVVPYGAVGVYTEPATFELPSQGAAEKLTVRCKDADAVIQTSEVVPVTFEVPEQTEQLVERGFQSFVYVTGITGFRFRCNQVGKTSRISFTAYW